MTRPNRLYIDKNKNSYFYIVGGKKRKIKKTEKLTQRQIQKVNIVNIVKTEGKRIKPKKRTKRILYQKKVIPEQKKELKTGIDAFYTPSKVFQSLGSVQSNVDNKKKDTESDKSLIKQILELVKESKPVIPKIPKPSVVYETPKPETPIRTPDFEQETEAPNQRVTEYIRERDKNRGSEPIGSAEQYARVLLSFGKKNITDDVIDNIFIQNGLGWPEQGSIEDRNMRKQIKQAYILLKQAESAKKKEQGETKEGGGYDGGLYNNQIENFLKKDTNMYVPVIASDQSDDIIKYIRPNMKKFAFVINTVPKVADGSGNDGHPAGHWRAVFLDNRDDFPSIEFFDPLGDAPEKTLIKTLQKVATIMSPEKLMLYKQNMVKQQNDSSSNCGEFCVKFISDRNRGVPFSKATGFDDYMEQHKVLDNSEDGEDEIEDFKMKKFDRYI